MIAITGVTGQLGRLIVTELLKVASADQIVGVARSPEKATDLADQGLTIRQGDYSDYDSLGSAFEGSDVLMFISNADFTRREEQHKNVVDAAKQAGVGRVVYTSVVQYGNKDPLTLSHANTEEYIKASSLPYTFLRDNFYMESYVVEVEIAMEKGAYRSPTPADAGAAFVSRADIARAAAAVLTNDGHVGKAYDMTGPTVVTPTLFAETATSISGKTVIHQPITWEELAEDYKGRGYPEEIVGLSVNLEQMIATNTLAVVSDDIAQITGTPAEDFTSFVRRTLANKKDLGI